MDATIISAIIGGGALIASGGWTALVAIRTSRNAARTNQATIDAAAVNTAKQLDAARDDRLWDAKAAAYAEAIELLRHMNRVRREKTRPFRWDAQTEEQIQEWLASVEVPEWSKNEARLIAFASPHVLEAVEANAKANSEANMLWDSYKYLASEAREAAQAGRLSGPDGDGVIEARDAALAAIEAAEVSAEKLIDAIRADLHDKPSESGRSSLPALPPPRPGPNSCRPARPRNNAAA